MALTVERLGKSLDMEPLNAVYDKEISGVFISDMVSDIMHGAPPGTLWVTVQTHKNIIAAANLVDVAAIVVTRGKSVPRETLEFADRAGITLYSTPLGTYALAVKLYELGIPP